MGAVNDKLYYSPVANFGAAAFIAAYVGGLDMPCETVDVLEKKTHHGVDYAQIVKHATLPSIVLTDGTVLTEEPVILEYIADRAPTTIIPEAKSKRRYLMLELIEHVSRSLMLPLTQLGAPLLAEEIKAHYRVVIGETLSHLDDKMSDYRPYVVPGDKLTIADFYLLSALDTCEATGIELNSYPHIKDYYERMSKLEKISEAKTKLLTNPLRTRGKGTTTC